MRFKKGLSDVVTTIIILLASVAITLLVVGISFGLLVGNSKLDEVYAIGNGVIKNDHLYLTLSSNTYVNITSLTVNGQTVVENVPIQPGLNNVSLPLPNNFSPSNYTVYSFQLTLSNGKTVLAIGTVD